MIVCMNTPIAPRSRGFTLIELMITVAIVAMLAALAYPSYRNYVLRGQLVDATNGLSALHANMERYFQDNRTYVSVGAFTSPCLAAATTLVIGSFQMSCSAGPTATTYTLQAAGSKSTNGFVFTIDQNGTQTTTITGVRGWPAFCPNSWVNKVGPTC
jgi:type IV pilus assembly protein PilE